MQTPLTSFIQIHKLAKCAALNQICDYKHSILLFIPYKSETLRNDKLSLNLSHKFNSRNSFFNCTNNHNYNVGKNKISEHINCSVSFNLTLYFKSYYCLLYNCKMYCHLHRDFKMKIKTWILFWKGRSLDSDLQV